LIANVDPARVDLPRGDGVSLPQIGELVQVDQGLAGPEGAQMYMVYCRNPDGSTRWTADIFDSELEPIDPPRVPVKSDFAPGTEFLVFEFECPLAKSPSGDGATYVAWYGGAPSKFDPAYLKVDNNWLADSFESWAALIERSIGP
jgi:hypothetical protein